MPTDDPTYNAPGAAPKKPATTTTTPKTTTTKSTTSSTSKPAAAPSAWGDPNSANFAGANITTITVGGLKFSVNRQAVAAFTGFINDLIAAGYHPKQIEGYNNRNIAGSGKKSNHAYGAAIDIDPGANPRYANSAGGKFALPPNVGTIAAKWGLNWGGNYKSSKDYMHFEAASAPASAGSKSSASSPATATPQEIKDQVAQSYGYLSGFLDDPEVGPLLMQAAKEGWDSARLQGALTATTFWKTHSSVTRQFDAQTRLDPATQKAAIGAQATDIVAQAKRAGVTLTQKDVATLAWTSLRYGWSGQQLTNGIIAQGKMDLSGKTPNAALTTQDTLKEQAAQYMVPVSDASLQKWVKDVASGTLSTNDFTSYLKEQAKSLFPGLAGAIDRGVTVEQYADPYRQQAAQTLEVDPQSIDFMHDPKYQKALFQIDPKTKDRSAMSLADWGTYLRTLPDYAKTHQANQQAASFGTSLATIFGRIAN